jgi:endonuclease YncB( thermonuclease family)
VTRGDTLALASGTTLRLEGVLAPDARDVVHEDGAHTGQPAQPWQPAEDARKILSDLALGARVRLTSTGPARDRYGRRVAQAFVMKADGTAVWLQGELLLRGAVRAAPLPDARACMTEMLAHETVARTADIGVWSNPLYWVRGPADRRALVDLARRAPGSFHVIDGLVERVSGRAGTLSLTLGAAGTRGVTVRLKATDRALLGAIGGDALALEGARVRVRGWLDRLPGGAVIDLSAGGWLEVVVRPDHVAAPRAPASRRDRARARLEEAAREPNDVGPGDDTIAETKTPGLIEAGRP